MNILDTDVEKLKHDQLEALREQMKKVFDDIYELFEEREYEEIEKKYIKNSHAGDWMGCENDFINFSWNDKIMDIGDILEMAKRLES